MAREGATELDGLKVILMDSINNVDEGDTDQTVFSASHGGVSSGGFTCEHRLGAVFFNDVGVGKENAGIAALDMREKLDIAAGTVDNDSAKIGDAQDHRDNGIVSHLNEIARYGITRGLAATRGRLLRLRRQVPVIVSSNRGRTKGGLPCSLSAS